MGIAEKKCDRNLAAEIRGVLRKKDSAGGQSLMSVRCTGGCLFRRIIPYTSISFYNTPRLFTQEFLYDQYVFFQYNMAEGGQQ